MNYSDFIKPELLVLVPVLCFIGMGLKKSAINDKFIPLILGSASVVLCLLWVIATSTLVDSKSVATAIFTAVTQGVLIAGASVYANQIVKQAGKDE